MPVSGGCDVSLGFPAPDGGKMTNANFRQLGVPVVRVGAAAITAREIDERLLRAVLGQSTDFKTEIFFDGNISVGSATVQSDLANFVSDDIGRPFVCAAVPDGTLIEDVPDESHVTLSNRVTDKFTDGRVDGVQLASATANFTSADLGRVIEGPNFTDGTVIASVTNAALVVLNKEGTDGDPITFQVNGRSQAGVGFQIAGRGKGWRLSVDNDGIGYAEVYMRATWAGEIQIGQFQVNKRGEFSIGSGKNMLRCFNTGTFAWGDVDAGALLAIAATGDLWSGAVSNDKAPTRIARNGDVTILDSMTSNHNVGTGVINPAVDAVISHPAGGAISNPTNVTLDCPTHYAEIYYRKTVADGATYGSGTPRKFTSATGNFTVLDVGKLFVTQYFPAGTLIVAVVSATEITLSADTTNASATTVQEWYVTPSNRGDTLYVPGTPIVLTATGWIAARAYKSGHYSPLVAWRYIIDATTVANPYFDPPPGSFAGDTLAVTIISPVVGSKIGYTTDGSTPTVAGGVLTNGTLIDAESGVISIPQGTTTVKAIAFKAGVTNPSTVTLGIFVVNAGTAEEKVATPTFTPPGFTSPNHAAQNVIVATVTTTNIKIAWTLDGSTPKKNMTALAGARGFINGSSGTVTIPLHKSKILKAFAYKTDGSLLNSDQLTDQYDFTPGGSGGPGGYPPGGDDAGGGAEGVVGIGGGGIG